MYSVKKLIKLFNDNPLLNRQIYTSHGSNGPIWMEYFYSTCPDRTSDPRRKLILKSRCVTTDYYKNGMDKMNPKLMAFKLLYLSNLYDKKE